MYCFGDPANMSDPSKRLALRIHDEASRLAQGRRWPYEDSLQANSI